jgi:hypothetical protein
VPYLQTDPKSKPKPYFYVSELNARRRELILDRRNIASGYSGALHVTLTAMTPLIFGKGELKINEKGEVFHLLSRENNVVTLPGSSFKGMLRSFFECVTYSCTVWDKDKDKKCSSHEMCPACTLFGRIGWKGKLRFTSFRVEGNPEIDVKYLPDMFAPRKAKDDERKLYKHSKQLEMVKKDEKDENFNGNAYECLPIGAKLSGEIIFEGLTCNTQSESGGYAELPALLFALGKGWEKPIYHKLGYGKPAYFGSVQIDVKPSAIEGNTLVFGRTLQDLPDFDALGREYWSNADEKLLKNIRLIEDDWSTLDGPNEWHTVSRSRSY